MTIEWSLGDALLAVGRDDSHARELAEESASIADRMHGRAFIPEARARAAVACVRLGDLTAARAHVAAAKAALLPEDDEADRITATAEAGLVAADGDLGAAERVLRECEARIAPTIGGFDLALLRMERGKVLMAMGRGGEAREQLMLAREFFHDPLAHGWQERIDALLAHADAPATP